MTGPGRAPRLSQTRGPGAAATSVTDYSAMYVIVQSGVPHHIRPSTGLNCYLNRINQFEN